HAAHWNLVVREETASRAGKRVFQRRVARAAAGGEVSVLLIHRRSQSVLGGVDVARPGGLPADKEERLILPVENFRNVNRAAQVQAELVALQEIRNRREKIARVKFPVAHKFERPAMHVVSPRFGDGIYDRAGVVAVLRAEVARLNAEFL